MRSRTVGLVLLASAALLAREGRPSPGDDSPAAEAAAASKMAADELKHWTIRSGAEAARAAVPRPGPILRYSNPGVGRVYGDVILFVADGRPEAVMAIYKWFTPWTGFEAEMHTLSADGLVASRDGRVAWRPDRAGLSRSDVPDAPSPSNSPVERLAQMRSIAGDFTARLVDARVNATGEAQALRPLPKPLYRHETPSPDGALFAFVLGTDPEVFLLVEADASAPRPRWRYALARMNRDPLSVTYKGKEVWRAEKVDPRLDPASAYFSMELPQVSTPP